MKLRRTQSSQAGGERQSSGTLRAPGSRYATTDQETSTDEGQLTVEWASETPVNDTPETVCTTAPKIKFM